MNLKRLPSVIAALAMIQPALLVQPVAGQAAPLQTNTTTNTFLQGIDGSIYVLTNGTLFRSVNEQGDGWEIVVQTVYNAAVDPTNANTLYATTQQEGVVKSLDRGKTWLTIQSNLPANSVNSLTVNPSSPNEIYAATRDGLYKTSDTGFSWQLTSLGGWINEFYLDPTAPPTAYALDTSGQIMVSLDGCQSWRKATTGLPTELQRGEGRTARTVPKKAYHLIPAGRAPRYLLAVFDSTVFRSDDRGATWHSAGAGLAPGPFNSAYVGEKEVILSTSKGLYRSVDGEHWEPLTIKTVNKRVSVINGVTRPPGKDGVLLKFHYELDPVARNPSQSPWRIGYIDKDGTLVGLTYGITPHTSRVRAVWSGTLNGQSALFASTEQEISVSVDNGYSWEPLGRFPCTEEVAIRPGAQHETWLFDPSGNEFLCLSRTEAGNPSTARVPGLKPSPSVDTIRRVSFDPNDKTVLYYTAGVNELNLYRYQYNSQNQQGTAVDLKRTADDVLVAEDNSKTIFALPRWLSLDGGWTWADKWPALQKLFPPDVLSSWGYSRILSLRGKEIRAVFPTNSLGQPTGFVVVKSENLGDSWEVVHKFDGQRLQKTFINPDDPRNVIVAAVTRDARKQGDVVRTIETRDGGESWREHTPVTEEKCPSSWYTTRTVETVLQLRSQTGRILLIGGCQGLWRSEDEGRSWLRLGGIR